ncbi:PREDICTED: uncharacterized protein LOC104825341 [Tarenaya hassleriana]|uniref:uncharacterized protein LOC104825341 n=1 Tax=Tarenaya hassleriana TaxID=28532 RepID=UPI00053C0F5A|nr:PREDICTED: uncharacterized protein LOC104825341 [Tarenaya hassleriana]
MVCLGDEENNHLDQRDNAEDSSEVGFVCGDPQVDPRVGDEYQVEVPSMMSVPELVSDSSSYSFAVGLSIQVAWIDNGTSKLGYEQRLEDNDVDMYESLRSLRAKCKSLRPKIKARQVNEILEPITRIEERLNLEAVPLQSASSWKDSDVDSFVLGLYTFGKNFTQVKKFMESKEMGEILSFYYGKFYKYAKYRSWSDSRKKRNRKCVCGMKLYSGWRQQELLSRLIPRLPDESQKDKLVNVSKTFAEGNTSLENFVSLMKKIVGLQALVDAVAIGKAKEDLTISGTEPIKTKQWFKVSSNTSEASPLASLTSSDIVKELTCGSRLSKARCNDIFWEAVWPRLLARGWHSEQPKDHGYGYGYGYVTSKDYLVFLVPGVKKFSRWELVRGNHYFDSVSDILKKVASDPELLEFGEVKVANEFVQKDSSDISDREFSPRDSQLRRFLRSPGPNSQSLHMKFTVLGTGLEAGRKSCVLWELRNLYKDKSALAKVCQMFPVDGKKNVNGVDGWKRERRHAKNLVEDPKRFTIVDTSKSTLRKISGDSFDGFEQTRACFDLNVNANENPFETLNSHKNLLERGADFGTKEETLKKDRGRSKRVIKHKFIRGAESNDHSVNSVPLLKRRRLRTCFRRETNRSGESPVFKASESDQTSLF